MPRTITTKPVDPNCIPCQERARQRALAEAAPPVIAPKSIPKVLHFLAPQPLSTDAATYIQSWKNHHPGWQFVIHHAGDKHSIVAAYGGVYVDLGVQCFGNIEATIGDKPAFTAGAGDWLIGCTGGRDTYPVHFLDFSAVAGQPTQRGVPVAILMPVHNGAAYLRQAIESVLAQTMRHWQLWIVDDGSTDTSLDIAYSYARREPRIRVLEQVKSGVSAARNHAFQASRSEFVAFLDSDDVFAPTALETLLQLAARYPGSPAVHGWCSLMGEQGQPLPPIYDRGRSEATQLGYTTYEHLKAGNFLWNPGEVLARRSALESVAFTATRDGALFDPDLSCGEDWDLWLRLLARGAFINAPVDVMQYRQHPGQVTSDRELIETACRAISKRYGLFPLPTVVDPLHRTETILQPLPACDLCIATVVTPDFVALADNLLGSIRQRGEVPDATVLVLALDDDGTVAQLCAAHRAAGLKVQLLQSRTLARTGAWSKSALYAVARLIEAKQYLCLDADTVVLGSLQPLLAQPADGVLAAGDQYPGVAGMTLRQAATLFWYDSNEAEFTRLFGDGGDCRHVVNDGVLLGHHDALTRLDSSLREGIVTAREWLDGRDVRNQMLLNVALAQTANGASLLPQWNTQLHATPVRVTGQGASIKVMTQDGQAVGIAHLAGESKQQFETLRHAFRLGAG